jgi:hypothetical protein
VSEPLHILSLGAGVQSSTMALMAAHGEIKPMPDAAIFADTMAEPKHVYEWLNWLEPQLPFPVFRVSFGNLHKDIIKAVEKRHNRLDQPPFFLDGGGMLWRKCTKNYKILPIEKKVRQMLGVAKGKRVPKDKFVYQWLGISCDEASRMKPSQHKWCEHRFPLIEKDMHRHHCLEWMDNHGYPQPKKSACTFCPYHNDLMWRDMKLNDPDSFSKAVEIDKVIRDGFSSAEKGRKLYLHRSSVALAEIDFRNAEDMGQLNMFNNECEGMCGV